MASCDNLKCSPSIDLFPIIMAQRRTSNIQEVLNRPFDFVIVGSFLSTYSEMQSDQ